MKCFSFTNIEQTDVVIPVRALDQALEVLEKYTQASAYVHSRHNRPVSTYLRQDILVEVCLQFAHLDTQNPFALGWQRSQDVLLEPPEHQVLKLLMQLVNLLLPIGISEVELVR